MKVFTKGLVLTMTAVLVFPLAVLGAEGNKVIDKRDPGKEPQTDQQFLVKAIACEVAEIKYAEGAAKNAENKDLRKFAQTMVDDHTKTRDLLLGVAKTMKLAVVQGLEKGNREELLKLMRLKGGEYDREFVRWTIEKHENALKMYETWSTKAKDSELRDIAMKAVPVVKEHLRMARELAAKLKA